MSMCTLKELFLLQEIWQIFGIEYQEIVPHEDDSMTIVFDLPSGVDATKPSNEVRAFADQCHQALLVAHPEFKAISTHFKYVNE